MKKIIDGNNIKIVDFPNVIIIYFTHLTRSETKLIIHRRGIQFVSFDPEQFTITIGGASVIEINFQSDSDKYGKIKYENNKTLIESFFTAHKLKFNNPHYRD